MGKVLVVDDSDAWCSAVAIELTNAGYSVIRAKHHEEALSAVANERPLLVMVDLLVAARAGAGFVRRMRSLPSMRDTPMLLATAGTDRELVQRAMGVGSEQIISKTTQAVEDLLTRLQKLPLSA